ncbi:hypothetical protein RD792_009403 [Penstemon davidsonii]|uniref:Isopenicillin N synthase-like Fe(2+) 2OG dioxygenase domain-containing protein n=1 Tax=Penstemon davidsonii TaxID=160366 RepID=A0ABR0CZ85_9LAMI|nr:hypothetical protein RD792_009403 [Penstemon davidsonii]
MPPAVGVVGQCDRIPMAVPPMLKQSQPPMLTEVNEAFAKDAIISWFRGEFAAANAIIDSLCGHLRQLEGEGAAAYESAFAAIHRRRLNWIPILQMQKYYSIADVTLELKKVAEKKSEVVAEKVEEVTSGGCAADQLSEKEKNMENSVVDEDGTGDESPESEITDTGSQDVQQPFLEHVDICSDHKECEARRTQIKITKGFVNVVKGLKLYEDVFTDVELSKLKGFVNELRVAGQNGELSGGSWDTFILYNQQTKGNKRELIQLGVSIFGQIKEDATNQFQKSYIEPIPALLQGVIEHLCQWHLIPENRKPNSCIINFFDEGEYSHPFLKPPHLDQPLSTLLLSESTMAFGRTLVNDSEGNYRGPLMLSLKEGSYLVMRGNSADSARHVMCSSDNKRVSITFFRVRTDRENHTNHSTKAMTLWQPGVPSPYTMPNNHEQMNMIPKWGLMRTPMVMLAPVHPMVLSPRKVPRDGTGVFLPWTVGNRKPARHLPPRAQRGRRFLALTSSVEMHRAETSPDSGVNSC